MTIRDSGDAGRSRAPADAGGGRRAGRRRPRHRLPGGQRLAAGQPARRGRRCRPAIEELGYVPNRAARALVTQRTDSVALVVSESEERVFGEPFFAGIVRGISSALTGSAAAAVARDGPVAGRAGAGRAPPDQPARRRRAAGLAARRRPAAGPAGASAGCRPCSAAGPVLRPTRSRPPTSTPTTPAGPGRRSPTCRRRAGAGSPPSPARRTWASGWTATPATGRAARGRAGRGPERWSRYGDFSRGQRRRRDATALLDRRPGPGRGLRRLRPDGGRRDAGAARARAAGCRRTWRWSASRTRRRPRRPTRR